jgi:anhydro-N-acetylmuramic acid kinase
VSLADAPARAVALGIMTGTSADGADAALVAADRAGARRRTELLAFCSRPFPPAMRDQVLEAQEGDLSARELLTLHAELGRHAALAARDALAMREARGHVPEVVGYHGQTVFHDPHGEHGGTPLSAQIGDPTAVARAAGCPVVSNFRMADVLAGGEGAPLVPLFDWHQFGSEDAGGEDVALLNLGGIANVTRLRPGAPLEDLVAFDCGPGNMLLDGLMARLGGGARYDAEGATAAQGRASEAVVREFLADGFIAKRPPKSAGREEYGAAYLRRFLARTEGLALPDRLRTAAAITAGAVARGVALSGDLLPQALHVSGGGARNATLLQAIAALLPRTRVGTTDALGVPVAAREAMAFAFLALETMARRAGNVPSATGAGEAVVLGSITPPPEPATRWP